MLSLHWWLNLATFAGIAILAVPVWDLNTRKRKLHQVRRAEKEAEDDSDFRARTRKILSEKHKVNVEGWRRRDQVCLLAGYVLLLGAAALRIVFP
jgi:membrane protein implicated in regulation of membrane protease activity